MMNNENLSIFIESVKQLDLSKVQFESLMALLEDCFHHYDAKFLYVLEDEPYIMYTISGLEDYYKKSSHLVNHFTYWLRNELRNGYIKLFSTKEELKQYILDNINMYYSDLMYDDNAEPIETVDDFKVCLAHSLDSVDNKIRVVSSNSGDELFSIGLVSKKSIFAREPVMA